MSEQVDSMLYSLGVIGPAALLAGLLAWWRGLLSPGALPPAPPHRFELDGRDLLMAGAIMLASNFLIGPTADALGIRPDESASLLERSFLLLFAQLFGQGPLMLYLVFRLRENGRRHALRSLTSRAPRREIRAGLLAAVGWLPVVMSVGILAIFAGLPFGAEIPRAGHSLIPALQAAVPGPGLWLLFFCIVVVAPLLEEFIFRGLVQNALLEWSGRRSIALLLGSALFTLIHAPGVPWQSLPGLFVLGLGLGWLYERYERLLPCIICHAAFNLANAGIVRVWGSPV